MFQTSVLERMFEENRYPDSETQERLAVDIGVTTDRVGVSMLVFCLFLVSAT